MTILDSESMHRLAKLALDSGEVASPEEALALFSRYRLRIHVGEGWAETLAGQACFLTAVNTAVRAFLGGVEVFGDLDPVLRVPLFEGQTAYTVVKALGGTVAVEPTTRTPTLVLGRVPAGLSPTFYVRLTWDAWIASIGPLVENDELHCLEDNPLAGVAAAALGVNEAFLHVRGDLPDAGHRTVGISLWNPLAVDDWRAEAHRGPPLRYLPNSLWLVGLGHLGQAYAWTLGMLPYPDGGRPHLVLQDFDKAAESNLSTCMLLTSDDLGMHKVRLVARRLEAAGFTTALVERRFGSNHQVMVGEPATALFGVDNIAARRDLGSAGFAMVVEAGLGGGYRHFRNIRLHTFPGPRRPSEIWTADDAVQTAFHLNDVYAKLALERNDQCGMTLLASRAVATPFVGAFAAALALAEVIRPLHGGGVHSTLDLQMKSLRYCNGLGAIDRLHSVTPYVQSKDPHWSTAKTTIVNDAAGSLR